MEIKELHLGKAEFQLVKGNLYIILGKCLYMLDEKEIKELQKWLQENNKD